MDGSKKKSSLNLIKINSFVCIAFDAIKKRAKSCINQQYQIPFHCYCTILVFLNLICIHLSSDKWQIHTYDTTRHKKLSFFSLSMKKKIGRKWGEIQSNLNFLCSQLSLSPFPNDDRIESTFCCHWDAERACVNHFINNNQFCYKFHCEW